MGSGGTGQSWEHWAANLQSPPASTAKPLCSSVENNWKVCLCNYNDTPFCLWISNTPNPPLPLLSQLGASIQLFLSQITLSAAGENTVNLFIARAEDQVGTLTQMALGDTNNSIKK